MKDVIKACVKPFTYIRNNLVSPVNGVEATSEAAKIAGEKTLVELISQRIRVQTTKYNAPKKKPSQRHLAHTDLKRQNFATIRSMKDPHKNSKMVFHRIKSYHLY